MQAIHPIIVQNEQGVAVTNLHEVLDKVRFGERITARERAEQRFGEGTVEAVRLLQAEFGIHTERPGEIDQLTAESINQLLLERGIFRLVWGQITNQDGSLVAENSVHVRAFDKENLDGAYLGSANTNADGIYQIFYDPLLYARPGKEVLKIKEVIHLVVQVYDANGETLAESQPLHDPEQKVRVDLRVGDVQILNTYIVRGQVMNAKGPLNGIQVNVFDRDLFSRLDGDNVGQKLGSGITSRLQTKNEEGWFEFKYVTADFAEGDIPTRKGDPTPDLIFTLSKDREIFDKFRIYRLPDGIGITEETLVSDDDLIMGIQARKVEEVRIVITDVQMDHVLTEYERLIQAIRPLLPEKAHADASDSQIEELVRAAVLRFDEEKHRDISFVARETGFDRYLILQLQDAFKQEREFDTVPAWVFFGISSSQQLSVSSVASMPLDEIISLLKPLQPAYDQHNLELIANNIKQFVQEQGIQLEITNLKASVGELLQPILASEAKLNTFLDAYARREGDIENFWKEMSINPDLQNEVPKIQLNLQLSQLTLNNLGLVNSLLQQGVRETRQLVDKSTEDWEELALKHKESIPSHITGHDDLARAKIYAKELQTLVELAFPTDVIKKGVQLSEVKTFLNNNPNFDFTCTPVDSFLQGQEERVFGGIENPEKVKNQLRQMQRLYTLTANATDMNLLMDMGYDSAHQIAKLSAEDFRQSLAGKISEENAQVYHAKAMAVSDTAAHLFHHIRESVISPNFNAANNQIKSSSLPSNGDTNNQNKDVLPKGPDWESLFGSLDTCECQHCKSVYSPAAYFVDLLHILLGHNKGAPREEIFRRRPDLRYTKLTCEHTENLIPYIDLVNEVLEIYVAQSHVGDKDAKSHAKESTNDTSDIATSDLAANPHHPNSNSLDDAETAYKLLNEATFPLNLPFDMDLEVARQFLHEQKSSRFNVLSTFDIASPNALAAERLGISSREFEILTLKQLDGAKNARDSKNTGDLDANDLWGNPTIPVGETLGSVLARARTFLDHSKIAYTDLIGLLKTHFLNPYFPINEFLQELSRDEREAWLAQHPAEDKLALTVIQLGGDPEHPCDLNLTQIRHLNGNFLSDEELSLFNRFIRLWKKFGCTITELDGLLTAISPVGPTNITPQVIRELSALWQVHQDLNISLDKVAVLIGNIPTYGKDSLFARLFLSKAILQIDKKFRLTIDQSEIKSSTESLNLHVPAILAALQISEDDFNRIVAYTGLNINLDTLTVANLSRIYRYVIFAKGLGLKIKDLITWLDLIPQKPWNTVEELVKTKTLLKKLKHYGFKAADFSYIFKNITMAGNMLPPKDEVIYQCVKTLREGLQKISQEHIPSDGILTIDFLKRELGNLLDPEEAVRIIGILEGTNTRDSFNDLLTLKISDNYKNILQNYLTPADVNNLAAIPDTDVQQRLRKYWEKIEVRLLPVLRRTFIKQHLTATFKADSALMAFFLRDKAILQTCLDLEINTPDNDKAFVDLYISLYKCLWLIEKLKLSEKELSYFQNNPNFNNFNWKDLVLDTWLRIADFVALRDTLPVAEKDLLSIFETAKNGGDLAKAIYEVTAWDKANIQYFVSKLTAADFLNEISLIRLQKKIELSHLIGVSIEKLESWAGNNVSLDQAQDIKRSLKTKYDEVAWIEVSTQVYNRIRNRLRDALVAYLLQKPEIKILGLKDTNDLYSYFLIDVEMDACMLTSRLKQAIASVQLFVQRCLLNLESSKNKAEYEVYPSQIDADQWKWMKNYRVWEANRKVFLYPENWIEPELRDNKSPFFKELESELLQGEVTNDNVEKALINYLEKLHDVARLDICGTYEDKEAQELHVFGRTFNSPPQYFYRKLDLTAQIWTPWERVQLDIQGNEEGDSAGVHLIPVVWNRRLYLFWPIFTEKSDREKIEQDKEPYKKWKERKAERESEIGRILRINDQNTSERIRIQNKIEIKKRERNVSQQNLDHASYMASFGMGGQTEVNQYTKEVNDKNAEINKLEQEKSHYPIYSVPEKFNEPEPSQESYPWAYYEVRIAWSEYRENRWITKKISHSFIRTPSDRYKVAGTYIYRLALILSEQLIIKLLYHPSMLLPMGEYRFNCNNRISVSDDKSTPQEIEVIHPKQVNFYQSYLSAKNSGRSIFWHEKKSFPLILFNKKNRKNEILSGSEQEYKVYFSADHNFRYNTTSRFFYQDNKRSYYVDYPGIFFFINVIPGLQDPKKIKIPWTVEKPLSSIVLGKVDSPLIETTDKLSKIPAEMMGLMVDTRQISSSTSLKIRSIQPLKSSAILKEAPAISAYFPSKVFPIYFPPALSVPKLQFKPFFHAYVCNFMEALHKNGIEGLLNLNNQLFHDLQPIFTSGGVTGGLIPTGISNNFEKFYGPDKDNVDKPYPMEEVDFSFSGAYSLYNWELFFHLPMLLANRLSKNQRFKEAMRWYHFVFNPTTNENLSVFNPTTNENLSSSARYWQVIPFRNTKEETLEELFRQLRKPVNDPARKELEDAITAWRKNPFNPHLIARMRLIAYQKNAVFKYLDNLIAWADNLFRQDTIESINEATQLYILAAELLGKRPEKIPARVKAQALNYAELEAEEKLDAFSNALVYLETIFPFYNLQAVPQGAQGTASVLNTTTPTLYFCLPDNDKLLGYWDTVADRLFKIRHCQNIEGVERQLALFEPPIDPALLVQAVAGGVDISSVLSDLNSPQPYYRFNYILQKALEACSELKSLGNSLLSTLEKKDAEALTMMRAQHETLLLSLAKTVKKLQITEAQRNREGLEKTREVAVHRANFYEQLLKDGLSSSEKEQQDLSFASMALSVSGQSLKSAASLAQAVPDKLVGGMAGPGGGAITLYYVGGGSKTANALGMFGDFFQMLSTMTSFAANTAQTNAGYQRRADDWKLQKESANKEIAQIDKQILAAQIREQIADQELDNHERQIENARQIEDFNRNKYTKEELYGWMIGEISSVYFQCYQLTYDLAKKAEKAYRFELGLPSSNFIQFGIWDSFRKGLMSGERLYLSLKQMEKSYMDQNRREFEITKNISLLSFNPIALITLKETGTCLLELPETLFDIDYPGHFMRRIRSVSITIPCVVGPYTSINCTLTLLSSEIRVKSTPQTPYAKQADDKRFVENFAAMQSIATSTAQNDSGLFELNFRDERYLPFEGNGVISRWRIELPTEFRQFDYQTITDVVLHLKYTARDGGAALRKVAITNLNQLLKSDSGKLQFRLFSLRHEFPSEWQMLVSTADKTGGHSQSFSFNKQRFPILFENGVITVRRVEIFGDPKINSKNVVESPSLDKLLLFGPDGQINLEKTNNIGSFICHTSDVDIEVKDLGSNTEETDWIIKVNKSDVPNSLKKLDDILILLHYTIEMNNI